MLFSGTVASLVFAHGGGSGLILRDISDYIKHRYGIQVRKYILDLSPGMLEIQRKNNPDVIRALCEDICETSLDDGEIDVALMIEKFRAQTPVFRPE